MMCRCYATDSCFWCNHKFKLGMNRVPSAESSFKVFILSTVDCRKNIRRRGVVGRVPAFQPCGSGSIPGGVRNFNVCPGLGMYPLILILKMFISDEHIDDNFLEKNFVS